MMASVGIHGVLAVLLPYIGNSSSQKSAPKTVQLVQLSPAEQSRLPQSALPTPLGASPLQGLDPLSGLSTPYPPLPDLGGLPSSLSPVNPPLNSLANNTTSPTIKTSPSPKVDPKTDKTKPEASKDTKITDRKLAPSQGPVKIQASNKREVFSSGSGLPNLNLTAADYGPVNPPSAPPTLYPPAPTGNQAANVAPPSQSSGLPLFSNQQTPGNNSRTPEPLVSPNIIGNNTNSDTPSSPAQELAGIKPATGVPPLPTPQLKPSGVEGGTGTSSEQRQRDGINALVANSAGVEGYKKHATIAGTYPKTACASKASGTSYIAAKVDNQGIILSLDPAPASNPDLDQAAKAAVSQRDMEVTNKTVTHLFPVEFKYDPDVCGSAAVPTPTEQPRNSTPKTPEAASTATPQTPAPKTPEAASTATPQTPAPKK
ncbi:MAG: hypothetical protein WBG73_08570 [Coleofasciculaceae cyanobacterium]